MEGHGDFEGLRTAQTIKNQAHNLIGGLKPNHLGTRPLEVMQEPKLTKIGGWGGG